MISLSGGCASFREDFAKSQYHRLSPVRLTSVTHTQNSIRILFNYFESHAVVAYTETQITRALKSLDLAFTRGSKRAQGT